MIFDIEVNNKIIKAKKGETILSALSRNGIKVPTLCYMEELAPTGACRICVVEVEGHQNLVPSCSHAVEEWMKIKTHSPKVIKARKTIVELLLSNHPDDCLYCERNGNCELQKLSVELNILERRISGKKGKQKADRSGSSMVRDPKKCILCGRCVRVCEEIIGVTAIDFIKRGNHCEITPSFQKGINLSSCINCGQCIMCCPTGALYERDHLPEIIDSLNNPDKHVVINYSPAISVTLAEEFGVKAGKDINGMLNAALRKIGFNKVFDTSFGADINTIEVANDLYNRIISNQNLPMFSSCCPAWVKYVEQTHPELIDQLATAKSPQQMMGSLIKGYYAETINLAAENIYSVSVMPCIAKKFEAQREEMTHKGITDVDAVLTTRELARLIRLYGIDIMNIESELTDALLGTRSSAGKLFAVSGGVAEAVLRTSIQLLTETDLVNYKIMEFRSINKGRKEYKIKAGKYELGFAVVSDMINAEKLLTEIRNGRKDLHFVEVMACPGGCVNGGGQPIPARKEDIKARIKAIYDIDDKESIKFSHKNPQLNELYKDFLGKPCDENCKTILHTSFNKRDVLL
ncbi:MAG: [FeFe] hydrogenase, group A [Bacteroidales bacterium]